MPMLADTAPCIQHSPDMSPPNPAISDWRAYLGTVREYADRRILFTFAAILLLGLMEGGGLVILLPMLQVVGIESSGPPGPAGDVIAIIQEFTSRIPFPILLGFFLLVIAGQTAAKTWLAHLSTRLQVDFTYFLRDRLHRALIGAGWSVFLQLRSSDVVRAFTGEVNVAAMGLVILISLASGLIQTTVHITAALFIAPTVTLIALGVGTLILIIVRPLRLRVRAESEAGQTDRGALAANITDHVGGLKLAKSHAAEDRRAQSFREISTSISERQVKVSLLQSHSRAWFSLGSATALCTVLWFAVEHQQVHGAELAIMAVIFMRLVGRIMSLQSNVQRLAFVFPAYRATEDLRARWLASAEPLADPDAPAPILRRQITLHHLSYCYPKSDRAALTGLSLAIEAGKTTALCGPSGAGKSTLADLVLGLIQPTEGRVTIDEAPLDGGTLRAWRRSVAYVPQDVFLFNDTVRENLLWLSPHATESDLWGALENAAAASLVRRLPQGLDTVVGDRGVRLSGGERQRLALARALLRQPSLLILDEATSALDHANEQLIRAAIERLHGTMTILIIAHRLSTIRHADQIVVLEEGHLVQSGTWNELVADKTKPFARMAADAAI